MNILNLEPKRNTDINSLKPTTADRVKRILQRMNARGYDAVIFEARRSQKRQAWLYGYGRTHHKGCKPKTWTLESKHLDGDATDIVSKRKLWNAAPSFWRVLKEEAERVGMRVIPQEQCHIQSG